jgi:hypothetical protein
MPPSSAAPTAPFHPIRTPTVAPTARRGIITAAMLRRRLFTLCSALSLVCLPYLLAGAVFGWTQSSRTTADGRSLDRRGFLHIGEWDTGPIDRRSSPLGFQYVAFRSRGGEPRWLLDIPYWPFIVVAGALSYPLLRRLWLEHRSKGRSNAGLCPRCGYDLRASPRAVPGVRGGGEDGGGRAALTPGPSRGSLRPTARRHVRQHGRSG